MTSLAALRSANAIGTGQTDDTAAIQAAIDVFSQPGPTGAIELPAGTYRITSPLVYRGDYGYGLRIRGGGSAAGPSGTVLVYDGPPGQAVVDLRGCTSTTVEHLAINCNGKARTGVAIGYDDEAGKGTSGVWLDHLVIAGGVGPYSSAVVAGVNAKGNRDARQCDRIILSNSLLVGWGKPGTTAYGFLAGWANCKNFAVRDCGFIGFGTGIKFGGSGYMIVDGFSGGGNDLDFEASTGNLEIRAGNSEQSAMLVRGSTGANSGAVTISNFSWAGTSNGQPIISYQGFLKLTGNYLRDESGPPRVELNLTPGSPVSCVSQGNFYRSAKGQPPIYDAWQQPAPASYVQSFGDYGGVEGNLEMLHLPSPEPGIVRATDLIVSGSIDFGDGRKWTPQGLFLNADQYWTEYGITPGVGVRWPGSGTLTSGPNESLRYVGWEERPLGSGNRRQGWVVPPMKPKGK